MFLVGKFRWLTEWPCEPLLTEIGTVFLSYFKGRVLAVVSTAKEVRFRGRCRCGMRLVIYPFHYLIQWVLPVSPSALRDTMATRRPGSTIVRVGNSQASTRAAILQRPKEGTAQDWRIWPIKRSVQNIEMFMSIEQKFDPAQSCAFAGKHRVSYLFRVDFCS